MNTNLVAEERGVSSPLPRCFGAASDDLAKALRSAPYADAPVSMTVVSADTHRIVAVNRTTERLARAEPGYLIGHSVSEYLSAATYRGLAGQLDRYAAGETSIMRAHAPFRQRWGEQGYLTVWLVPCVCDDGVNVLVLAVPRTGVPLDANFETVEVEKVELERLAPLPGAMALVTDAAWNVRSVCPQFARALDHTVEALPGTSVAELVHPEDVGFLVAAAARADGGSAPCSALDVRFRSGDGRWVSFASSAAPLRSSAGFDGLAITAFTHSQLHTSITRVARLAGEIQQLLEDATGARTVQSSAYAPLHSLLSAREREIVEMVAAGLRVSTIAERLYIAPGTVRNHLSAIFRKFGVSSQAELAELLLRDATKLRAGSAPSRVP